MPEPRLVSETYLTVCPTTVELVAAVPAVMADGAGLDRDIGTAVNRRAGLQMVLVRNDQDLDAQDQSAPGRVT